MFAILAMFTTSATCRTEKSGNSGHRSLQFCRCPEIDALEVDGLNTLHLFVVSYRKKDTCTIRLVTLAVKRIDDVVS